MELYYMEELEGSSGKLVDEQFRHAVKVMRKREGDKVILTDGKGAKAEGTISSIGKHEVSVAFENITTVPRPGYGIDIALALTKNIKRIEWALEKMTEMGVRSIVPIVCRRSERDKAKTDRLKKILVSALKQSQQFYLPVLYPLTPFAAFCNGHLQKMEGDRFIAHLSPESKPVQHNYDKGKDVCIIIGPEGDFTDEEVALAIDTGCIPVSLGYTRLRTETAAVAAVAYIHALND